MTTSTLPSKVAIGLAYERGGAVSRALRYYREAVEAEQGHGQCKAMCQMADAYRTAADMEQAMTLARQAYDLALQFENQPLQAEALNIQALVHQAQARTDQSVDIWHRILEMDSGQLQRGHACLNLSTTYARSGDTESAVEYLDAALVYYEAAEYARGALLVRTNKGCLMMDTGRYAEAQTLLAAAMEQATRQGDVLLAALCQMNLGETLMELRQHDRAHRALVQTLGQFDAAGDLAHRAWAMRVMGENYRRQGEHVVARSCLEKALEAAERAGARQLADSIRSTLAEEPS